MDVKNAVFQHIVEIPFERSGSEDDVEGMDSMHKFCWRRM
jgi:hypothetical protein